MEPGLMKDVFVAGDAIVSPLGRTSAENYYQVRRKITGISKVDDTSLSDVPVHVGRINWLNIPPSTTRFEAICIEAIQSSIKGLQIPLDETLLILSTTKGNISYIDEDKPSHPHIHLHSSAEFLKRKFGFARSIVVSNACISGVMAIAVGARFIRANKFKNIVIVGADTLSHFIVSGFQSLQALSDELCRPFDQARKGINLGEAAACVVLTSDPRKLGTEADVRVLDFSFSNDANHISGPSRTGQELANAVGLAIEGSGINSSDIDFISAHGTATIYNDEMEAKAFNLAGLSSTPVNSLKSYFGHTLGAAGILETVIGMHSLRNNELIPTLGFEKSGVSQKINVIDKLESKPMRTFLKTASGFGGCNAAMVLQRTN